MAEQGGIGTGPRLERSVAGVAESTLADVRAEVADLRRELAAETTRRNRWLAVAAVAGAELARALVVHLLS